jgi:predicted nucleotidyltransferase
MHSATDEPAQATAIAFAHHVAQLWEDHLGHRLVGIYLLGSLAHGGFSARYSDIDMALIAGDPLSPGELDLNHRKAAAYSVELASKLSLFWADQSFSAGRFPPLDRADYIDHAVALVERRRIDPPRPTLQEIRAYLGAEPFRNWSSMVDRFNVLDELPTDDHKRYLRALLYPARFLYSWHTGQMGSNDRAVEFVQCEALVGPELDLIVRALRCRNEGRDPLPLFSGRPALLRLRDLCRERIAQG